MEKKNPWKMVPFKDKDGGISTKICYTYSCAFDDCMNETHDISKWKFIDGYNAYMCPTCVKRTLNLCDKCGNELDLCPSDYPYSEEHWICGNCDSTYSIEDKGI